MKNNSAYYTSEKIFNSEIKKLKSKYPVFVTSLSNLKNEGDYVLFNYYGEEFIAAKSKKKFQFLETDAYIDLFH